MNKKKLDHILKKNPKKESKYHPYKDEIEYLYDNGATLDVISEYLFQEYKLEPKITTLFYYIKRNISNVKHQKIKVIKSEKSVLETQSDASKSPSKRFKIDTSKRQTIK